MKKQFSVFFDKEGNQLTDSNPPDYWQISSKVLNYEFTTNLKYKTYEASRSGIFVVWEDGNGKQYKSSMQMLHEILTNSSEDFPTFLGNALVISGIFTFKKQGTAVLLTLKK